jgi:hypothetical protein
MKLEFSPQIFEKYSNIKFHENPSSGIKGVPCGQTDMTKLIVAFCNFSKTKKKSMNNFSLRTYRGMALLKTQTFMY